MTDESDPPRKFYQLKPREFEVVNEFSSQSRTPPSAGQSSSKIEVRDHFLQASTPGPLLSREPKPVAANQVHGILVDNLVRANAAGLNDLAPMPKRRLRRHRDFALIVVPLDAFFSYAAFGPHSNPATLVYGVAGIIVTTLCVGWVIYFVMDKY